MSENDTIESKGIIIPYVTIDRVIEVLTFMHKQGDREKFLTELCTLLGWKRSNLNNITPTIGLLGLGEVHKGKLIISIEGLNFSDAVVAKDEEKAKQIIKKNINNSNALKFTRSLLESRSSISTSDIGKSLSERFQKKWDKLPTYRYFGNACASILSYAGIGHYYDGVLSLKPPTFKAPSTFYAPSIGYNPILNLLKALHSFDRATLSDIAKNLKTAESNLSSEITVCTILKLVEKETGKTYHLTDEGRQLIDPTISAETKSDLFRKCLLKSQYGEIIQKLSESGKHLSYKDIGDILSFFMKRDWADKSKLSLSKKFVTWLNNAGLTEKIKPGIFKINPVELEILDNKKITDADHEGEFIDVKAIYEIGRTIGALESIVLSVDETKFFNEKLSLLKGLLEEHEDIKMTLEMLGNNFEIATSTKNPTVYQSNMDFVRNKVKEKIFGGKKV